MLDEYREKEREKATRLRSVMDYAMGVLLIIIGACFLLYQTLRLDIIMKRPHGTIDYVIGVMFVLYGSWRIYRGYKKQYNQ